jgi:Domain of unknown function (DUF1905)
LLRSGAAEWTTSLFGKDGRFVVPVKDAVRRTEEIYRRVTRSPCG